MSDRYLLKISNLSSILQRRMSIKAQDEDKTIKTYDEEKTIKTYGE